VPRDLLKQGNLPRSQAPGRIKINANTELSHSASYRNFAAVHAALYNGPIALNAGYPPADTAGGNFRQQDCRQRNNH